jgi:hypothetical protein
MAASPAQPTDGAGWTLKSLYELVREIDKRHTQALDDADKRYEERYVGQLREVKTALDGQAQAVQKAENASEKRFDEFRREIAEKLDDLIKSRDTGAGGRIATRELFAYALAIASIAAYFWKASGH